MTTLNEIEACPRRWALSAASYLELWTGHGQTALDMDDLMADCRQAFVEAKENFAGLMTPAQVNRFVSEVVGR